MESREGAELPIVASGEQIRGREFATVRRGYDPAQVRGYLTLVSTQVDALERSLDAAKRRATELEEELKAAREAVEPAASEASTADPYEELSKRFAGVLVTADSEAAHVVEQARAEADRITADARARAEESRLRGSQAMIAAREESDRMMASLAERRVEMLQQLHEMQSRLLSVAEDLEVAVTPGAQAGSDPSAPDPALPEADPDLSDLPDLSMLDLDLVDERDAER